MRGRKPVPTNLKKLQGTFRADRARKEPKPPSDLPTCPDFLSERARAEWRRLASTLHAMGVLTPLDRAAFAAYCASYAHAVDAEKAIGRDGLMLKGPRGRRYVNPHVAIARRAWDEVRRFALEFGMTPSSRSRLHITPPLAKPDESERFLFGPRYRFGRRAAGTTTGSQPTDPTTPHRSKGAHETNVEPA